MVFRMAVRGLATATALAVGFGTPPSAEAQCVYAEVYVSREGASPIWVLGEGDPCIAPTPWTWGVLLPGDTTKTGLPTGAPNGYHHDIRIPSPV